MPPLVDIAHLEFAYPRQRRLTLRHIDLKIESGAVLGLIGPNGGGKTTLIKLLLGLLKPTRGAISIDNQSPREALKRGDVIGYLPQNPALPENFPISVRQLVRLGLAGKTGLFQSYSKQDCDFVETLIQRIGLAENAQTPVGELSGGQLQRALIARALAARPKLLLLDEPTTGVDSAGQKKFVEFMQQLRAELNLTVVFVSHDLRAVSAMADRIACLNASLHYHDTPDHLPAELVYRMFACDLEAMGLGGAKTECSCEASSASTEVGAAGESGATQSSSPPSPRPSPGGRGGNAQSSSPPSPHSSPGGV